MTSGRVYQAAVDGQAALAELRRSAGGHFDPVCVEAFAAALGRVKGAPSLEVTPASVVAGGPEVAA